MGQKRKWDKKMKCDRKGNGARKERLEDVSTPLICAQLNNKTYLISKYMYWDGLKKYLKESIFERIWYFLRARILLVYNKYFRGNG